jgi:iron-sulfur cluster repair protein YtfE (RIC family)
MMPSAARDALLAQHARLRVLFGEALALARLREATGDGGPALEELMPRISRAFAEHNRYEEAVLRPVLLARDGLGPVRVERMMEEHVEEHRAFVEQLAAGALQCAAALADFVEEVEAHMAAEERVFLNVAVLRDP